tara:strand:- start:348 stop:821 length:474 start_codon:yes stop_codon:yes gene_type:complete
MFAQNRSRHVTFRLLRSFLTVCGIILLTGLLQAQTDSNSSVKEKAKPGTSAYHQPGIADARLVVWGVDTSIRAYYFDTNQQAESFSQAIKEFQIATPFQLVVTKAEQSKVDYDKQRVVSPPNYVEQIERKNQVFVLLEGTRRQHSQIESVMRAVGRD